MSSTPSSKSNSRGVRIGKYEILSHIATGGMGAVYKARDTELNREVALKVLSPELAAKPNLVERFRREARSAAKLRHKNIVSIYECGESTGTHYLVMEYIDGMDLGDYLRAKGKLEPKLAWILMRQAAKALAHAYEQGIVHRDIKPSNFLLTKKDKRPLLKLTDMGLAREVNEEQFRVTTAGTTVGTVDYMSPEQARDSQAADTRSDLYSLGCAFFHILTGQPPFEGSLTERILKHLESKPPDICQLNPAVPVRMKQILEKLLEKNPRDRYQTPLELIKDLNHPPAGLIEGEAGQENVPSAEEGLAGLEALALDESFSEEVGSKTRPRREKNENSTEQIQLAKTPSSIKIKRPTSDSLVLASRAPTGKKPKSDEKVAQPAPATKPRPEQAAPEPAAKTMVQPVKAPKKKAASTHWMLLAGIGAGLAAVVFVSLATLWLLGLFSAGSDSTSDTKEKQPNRLFPVPAPSVPGGKKVPAGNKVEPLPVETLPVLFTPVFPRASQDLREEFEGPHLKPVLPPAAAKIYKVSRSAVDAMSFPTLEEALERTASESPVVIEIHENGPLLERTVAAMVNRHITIRAGKGYHPLVIWDIPGTEKEAPPFPEHFLAVNRGSLRLENLHFAVMWEGTVLDTPSAFFTMQDSSLTLEGCTVSVAGKHPKGFVICQLRSTGGPVLGLIHRCYFRAEHGTALAVDGPQADVLVRDSLLFNGASVPLLRAKVDFSPATLRLVRSTLVSGNHLLKVQPQNVGEEANVRCWNCDCLLAHPDGSPDRALVVVSSGTMGSRNWKAFNCVYAGWNHLLDSQDRKIAGTDLDGWHGHWGYYQGDQVLPAAWPTPIPKKLAECPAAVFQARKTPACFAAMTGPGPLGCDPQTLAPPEDRWLESAKRGTNPLLFPKLPRPGG